MVFLLNLGKIFLPGIHVSTYSAEHVNMTSDIALNLFEAQLLYKRNETGKKIPLNVLDQL